MCRLERGPPAFAFFPPRAGFAHDVEDMTSKLAFITGAASGIGAALAKVLAQRDLRVVLADRQYELAAEVAESICRSGGQARAVELDVRDAAGFERAVTEAVFHGGRIDYLFNNAGIGVAGEALHYELADWYDVFDVNLRGVVHGVQAVYPLMCRQGFGHIINTSSMAGLIPTAEAASYTATKHAVVGLSKGLRVEAAQHGVKVSVLCPGVVRTPILGGGKYGRLNFAPQGESKLREIWERFRPMDAEVFARKVLRGIDRNAPIIVVPSTWKLVWALERLSPSLALRACEWGHRHFRDAMSPYRLDRRRRLRVVESS